MYSYFCVGQIETRILIPPFVKIRRQRKTNVPSFYQMTGNYKDYLDIDDNYVYCITNKISNTIYIGTTYKLFHRIATYYHDLNRKTEHNIPILRAFKKYGFNNFEFNIIESFDTIEEMYQKEIDLIKHIKDLNIRCYNVCAGGKASLAPINYRNGVDMPQATLTENEIISTFVMYHFKLMSASLIAKILNKTKTVIKNILNGKTYKNITGNLIEFYGRIRKRTKSNNVKWSYLKENDVIEIIEKYFVGKTTIKEIANLYNVAESTISAILAGKNWKHITKDKLQVYKNRT